MHIMVNFPSRVGKEGTRGPNRHSIWSQQALATKCVEPPNSL